MKKTPLNWCSTSAKDYVDVYGCKAMQMYDICVSPETMLMSRAMIESLLCTAEEGRVDVCGLY